MNETMTIRKATLVGLLQVVKEYLALVTTAESAPETPVTTEPSAPNNGVERAKGVAAQLAETLKEQVLNQQPAPTCAVHNRPMHWRQTSKGNFWSCSQKTDGKWCTYRPARG